jgi:hypothetical protein
MSALSLPIHVRVNVNNDQSVHWYQGDIVSVAKKMGYYANLTRPRLWVRMRMEDTNRLLTTNTEIVVSFHYFGRENRGIMIATAFLNLLHTGTSSTETSGEIIPESGAFRETHPLVLEGFIITHTDQYRLEQKQREFKAWLDQAVAIGLTQWERQL